MSSTAVSRRLERASRQDGPRSVEIDQSSDLFHDPSPRLSSQQGIEAWNCIKQLYLAVFLLYIIDKRAVLCYTGSLFFTMYVVKLSQVFPRFFGIFVPRKRAETCWSAHERRPFRLTKEL